MAIYVDKARWDALTENEQKQLQSLGMEREPDKKSPKIPKTKNPITLAARLAIRHTSPVPYFVDLRIRCLCCGDVKRTIGKMDLPYDNANYLKLRQLTEDDEVPEFITKQGKQRRYCPNCEENLLGMDKQILVSMILSQVQFHEKDIFLPDWKLDMGKRGEMEETEETAE